MCFVSLGRGPDPRVRPLRQLVNPPPRDTQHHLADWPTRFLPPTGQSSVRRGTLHTAPPTGQLPPTA